MDFNLKQWRDQQHESAEADQEQQQPPSAKLPRLLLDLDHHHHHHPQHQPSAASSALPLFVPEPTSKLSNMSAYSPDHSSTPSATRFPKMGSYFSLAQWQELELQALIFRHMLAGAAVPPELLHIVKKSLLNSPSAYYLSHPLQHYSPYQPAALLQTGYWGRGAMDPEPGRCRRTDGKKWRCSRDVVAGHKYCERHMHRGRNRSRKPVEIPTPTSTNIPISSGNNGNNNNNTSANGNSAAGGVLKTNNCVVAQPLSAMAHGTSGRGDAFPQFALSGSLPSVDLLQLNHRSSESLIDNKGPFEAQNDVSGDGKSGGRVLRHFFDDWPRSLQESDHPGSNASSSATNLTISMPDSSSSDFSLKLSTGDGDESGGHNGNVDRDRGGGAQLSWGSSWGTNQVASMGGPLAEALRSSTNSSPTSVLHQLPRGSILEASYISTRS